MDKDELLKKYDEYKKSYYDGSPLISDEQFDSFEKMLIDDGIINKKYVGAKNTNSNVKYVVTHDVPMLSLDKVHSLDEIIKFDKKSKDDLFCTLKLDGNSLGITYVNGVLTSMKTRGDGVKGFDVSNRIPYINILKSINELKNIPRIEIRGELLITNENFELLCKECSKRGIDKPSSQRNIVAGLLNPARQQHIDLIKYCSFYAYGVDNKNLLEYVLNNNVNNELELFKLFESLGFNIPVIEKFNKVLNNKDEIEKVIEWYAESVKENKLNILTDGLVFSKNNFDVQDKLGINNHGPNYKVAYKLKSEIATTTILDFEYAIGKSGKLNIVAIVEPVELSGATINRVTMHNIKNIIDNNIVVGSVISITRSGEVIPKFLEVVYNPQNLTPAVPVTCPHCNSKLEWSDTRTDLYCRNKSCSSINIRSLLNWARILEIEGLSIKTIQKFYNTGILLNVDDIFNLKNRKSDILSLEGFKIKSVNNLVNEISKIKEISFSKIIEGCNIQGVGKRVSVTLSKLFNSIDDMDKLTIPLISSMENYGAIMANNIVSNKDIILHNYNLLNNIEGLKIVFEGESKNTISNEDILTFVVTGSLSKPRKEIENDITDRGHKLSTSITKNVNYLVCNEKSNSDKYTKAIKLNIPIIDEKELNNILKGGK